MIYYKFKNIIYILVIALFITGCVGNVSQKDETTIKIIDSITVTANTLIYEKDLQDPWNIAVIDTVLIIGNFNGEPLLELYSTSGDFLLKCLNKGHGPTEVLSIGTIQVDFSGEGFFINDILGKKILRYDLNLLLTDTTYEPELFCLYKDKDNLIGIDKVYVGENFFVAENRSPDGRIVYTDSNMLDVKYYANIPTKVHEDFDDFGNAQMFSTYITMSPNQKYIGAFGAMAAMIDLYEIENNHLDSIWSCYEYFPNNVIVHRYGDIVQGFFTPKSLLAYSGTSSSNKYAYSIYANNEMANPLSNYGDVIRRIKWKDQSISLIRLNRAIKSICITNDDKIIYGVGIDNDGNPEIIECKL